MRYRTTVSASGGKPAIPRSRDSCASSGSSCGTPCWEAESLWQELRAEEIVQAEIAAEFDGEDPVAAEVRDRFRETKECLDQLLSQLAGRRKRKRPEPEEAMLDRYRAIVDGTFEKLGLIKDL
jgi:hypothetical protein